MKVSKNILSFFAKNVRDAATEEEVNEIVETTDSVLNEETQKDTDEVKDMTPDTEAKLLEVLLELSTVIKDLKGKNGAVDAEPEMIEEKDKVISEDADPAMENLNKFEDSCKDSDEEELIDSDEEVMEDEERPIEEVVESSKEISDEDPAVPVESNTFSKIVKDMKPILARISNAKERKSVCDALAKTLGRANRSTSNSYSNIMRGSSTKKVMDNDLSNDKDMQSYYDSLNPHNK